MQTKKYLITNNSEGSICVTGRTRIDIPGKCKDLVLTLPENTACHTISRLKQGYPLLKIREAQVISPVNSTLSVSTSTPEKEVEETNNQGNTANANRQEAGLPTPAKNDLQTASLEDQTTTPKASNKKK